MKRNLKILLILIIFVININVKAETIENNLENLISDVKILKKDLFLDTHPVGSVYITTNSDESTIEKMKSKYGGTWVVYGNGKTLLSSTEAEKTGGSNSVTLQTKNLPSHSHNYDKSATTTGGTTLTLNQIPSHSHANTATSSTISGKFGAAIVDYHSNYASGVFSGTSLSSNDPNNRVCSKVTGTIYGYALNATPTITVSNAKAGGGGSHNHSITLTSTASTSTGLGESFSVQNEYITAYIYKRTE